MSIATKKGDGGTTGLLYGGRVPKDSLRIKCNGAVDEAQAALGLARCAINDTRATGPEGYTTDELDQLLVAIERDLWVLMAEVATPPAKRPRLVAGMSLVTEQMVNVIDDRVHELEAAGVMPKEFTVPGQSFASASLDVARTVVRRAERRAVQLGNAGSSKAGNSKAGSSKAGSSNTGDSFVVPYLNRLSDLCWLLARAVEGEHLTARQAKPARRARPTARPTAQPKAR